MQLSELFDYKNQLMKDLLTNEEIIKLVDENATLETASSLAYTKIFPYEYIPETAEHGATYICFDVDIQKSISSLYLLPTIYIWVFTHSSLLRLNEGGVRTDALCNKIAEKINGSKFYGLGELDLYSVKRFAPMTDYNGKMLTFNAVEFGRTASMNRAVPVNRKLGV